MSRFISKIGSLFLLLTSPLLSSLLTPRSLGGPTPFVGLGEILILEYNQIGVLDFVGCLDTSMRSVFSDGFCGCFNSSVETGTTQPAFIRINGTVPCGYSDVFDDPVSGNSTYLLGCGGNITEPSPFAVSNLLHFCYIAAACRKGGKSKVGCCVLLTSILDWRRRKLLNLISADSKIQYLQWNAYASVRWTPQECVYGSRGAERWGLWAWLAWPMFRLWSICTNLRMVCVSIIPFESLYMLYSLQELENSNQVDVFKLYHRRVLFVSTDVSRGLSPIHFFKRI